MKKFLLILKSDNKPVYCGQVFEGSEVLGLIGGSYQSQCYWVDVTALSAAQITANKTKTFTPDEPPSDTMENAVVVSADGTWV